MTDVCLSAAIELIISCAFGRLVLADKSYHFGTQGQTINA